MNTEINNDEMALEIITKIMDDYEARSFEHNNAPLDDDEYVIWYENRMNNWQKAIDESISEKLDLVLNLPTGEKYSWVTDKQGYVMGNQIEFHVQVAKAIYERLDKNSNIDFDDLFATTFLMQMLTERKMFDLGIDNDWIN